MTCLAEERMIELLDEGGLDASRPDERAHLDACESCRESWGAVAAAADLLSESRPKAAGRASRWIPLGAAAAMLVTILAVIAMTKTPKPIPKPEKDPVTLFIEGTPEEMKGAAETLLKGGRNSLLGMAAVRATLKGKPREKPFLDLMWAIKVGAARQDAEAKKLLDSLESFKIDLSFENTQVTDVVGFMNDFSKLNVLLDPAAAANAGHVETYAVKDQTLREALEVLCAVKDLDFDVRYGVIFIGKPMRIWSTDPQIGLPGENQWQRLKPTVPDQELGLKVGSIRLTVDMQNAPLSAIADYIREVSGIPVTLQGIVAEEPLSIRFKDLTLTHALELLSLPYGRDVTFDTGRIVFFVPKK